MKNMKHKDGEMDIIEDELEEEYLPFELVNSWVMFILLSWQYKKKPLKIFWQRIFWICCAFIVRNYEIYFEWWNVVDICLIKEVTHANTHPLILKENH